MRTRRLAFSSAALALAVAGLGSIGCAEQSAAARVGDEIVSESDLLDELEVLADVSPPEQTEGELGRSYQAGFAGQVLQQRIVILLVDRVLDEEGVEVTDEDRALAEQQVQADPAFAELPGWYQELTVGDVSHFTKLGEVYQEDGGLAALLDMADQTDVEISSHYGTWDPSLLAEYFAARGEAPSAVVPPAGPRPAPST